VGSTTKRREFGLRSRLTNGPLLWMLVSIIATLNLTVLFKLSKLSSFRLAWCGAQLLSVAADFMRLLLWNREKSKGGFFTSKLMDSLSAVKRWVQETPAFPTSGVLGDFHICTHANRLGAGLSEEGQSHRRRSGYTDTP
jgi:hypothetical protein